MSKNKIQPKIQKENGDMSRTTQKQPGSGMKSNTGFGFQRLTISFEVI